MYNDDQICGPEAYSLDIVGELIRKERAFDFTHLVIAICEDGRHN